MLIERIRAALPEVPRGRARGVSELLAAQDGFERQQSLMARVEREAHAAVSQVYLGGGAEGESERPWVTNDIAPMWQRLVARLLDVMFLMVVLVLFSALALGLGWDIDGTGWQVASFVIGPILLAVIMINTGTTFGKRTMNLAVDSSEGGDLSTKRVFLREFVGRAFNELSLGIGYLMAFRDPTRRTWGDRFARTIIVRTRSDAPMRVLAPVMVYGSILSAIVMLPLLADFSNPSDKLLEALTKGEPSVLTVVDSVKTLAERPVDTDEQYRSDLEGVIQLAKDHEDQLTAIRGQTSDWLWKTRFFAPWRSREAAIVDSLGMRVESSVTAGRRYAEHALVAKYQKGEQARIAALARDYDLSDLDADYEYVLILMRRLGWGE